MDYCPFEHLKLVYLMLATGCVLSNVSKHIYPGTHNGMLKQTKITVQLANNYEYSIIQ